MYWCFLFTNFVLNLFRFIWLIVGAIMFWGYLTPKNYCGSPVNGYMWANLIIGFILSLGSCLGGYKF